MKGMIFFERQDYEKAAQFLEHAANTDPAKAPYWEHLALAQSRHPLLHRKAETSFLRAIQLNPTNYLNYYELGMLYGRAGLLTSAIEKLEEAMKWDPTNAKMQRALAEFRAMKEGKPLPDEKDKDKKPGGVLGGLFGKKPQS